ncbi:MAG: amidohydrolase family protein [Tepidisphaeraceae bacterium]|jgi:putative selenium metabolism protein SsnA
MAIVLRNALLADLDPIGVERGDLRIESGRIAGRVNVTANAGDEIVDCAGAVVLPGLVNGHTHLYSALAVGMPAPARIPRNFLEILQSVWWRLDQALDGQANEVSARIGALDALHCGTTTLIDHHASPNSIDGPLDRIEAGLASVGARGVLCYETTDRHGRAGRDAGIAENDRYLRKCAGRADGRFAALVGGHASFTLDDDALDELARLAQRFDSGVHIHVAEDPCDEEACRRVHGMALIDRLERHGLLKPGSVFAHGTHLGADAIARVNAAGVTMAHNPRSNMNNAVGYAPIGRFRGPVMLGTDGIGGDMFSEARHAWFKSRDGGAGISPADVIAMLAASASRASASLGVTLGKLIPGAEADVVITDYVPFTPLAGNNFPGHFIFALGARNVRHVMVGGQWAIRERVCVLCDELAVRAKAMVVARGLWERMAER